ncbi:hypothetical protein LXM25_04685 [Dyadobacter sp. LJ53]|uniref:hypothetical protein n=1 Tax=Dyadobacter chenwenxiniae TaxID=2906456 RepID=UPI001F4649B6|nr:hypothetical protein [Dyadobacter chenwenxiniae]MCF0049341.1 hypothetical protein [Dyadobacter chenwenxiniae]
MKRLVLLIVANITLHACGSSEQYYLDEAIPRLQSPVDQIASLRTQWRGGEHIETVFYDRKGRVIEKFNFGQSSLKELHFYKGDLQKKSIYYSHSDSSEPGVVSIDTVTRDFDANGRLLLETHLPADLPERKSATDRLSYSRHLSYTAKGDTIVKLEGMDVNDWQLVDIDRWERDDKDLLKHHYRLYVIGDPAHPDTVYHFSQRFTYDKKERLRMVWFDSMYLGKFYSAPGPDTVLYHYNNQNQLSGEEHVYTSDMRNKREVDTTRLSKEDREMVASYRQRFMTNAYGMSNARYVIVYKYEKFDPARHGKLIIPSN